MADANHAFDLDNATLKKGAGVLRALNHKLRQELLQQIHKKQRTSVTELYVKLRLEQSVASQHLAILRRSGFVTTERDGKKIYYTVNYSKVAEVQRLAARMLTNAK